jgi:hypothetical protein
MPPKENVISEFNFNTFGDFILQFGRILFEDGIFQRERFLFRGQGDANFVLQSAFDRRFSALSPAERVTKYDKLIAFLKEEFARIGIILDDHKALGFAQHNGMPTRLLDWSSSPLVAAYFAFHESISNPKRARYVSIWALDQTNRQVWNRGSGVEVLRLELNDNARATRQLGFATNIATPDDTLEGFVLRLGLKNTALWKFNINSDDARAAFAFLDARNTRATELFGDVIGASRTALERLVLLDGT